MKLSPHIVVGTMILLTGLTPAFGKTLSNRGKSQTVNRWPYSFGDRYIYDNGGSNWNYDSLTKHRGYRFRENHRHKKLRHLRLQNVHKGPASEKLDRLIKQFTRNSSRHDQPFCHIKPFHYHHFDRRCVGAMPEYPPENFPSIFR